MDHNLFNWLPIERASGCFQPFPYKHSLREYPVHVYENTGK